ncbi:hypothetical protein RSOLAG1IB_01888 [Rhizoctonia solani AG-1 IB]|uniref:CHAT domain-containing protein n=1 Tax=Thanatephorus cucumeris (strain AG1-IB / isolate 7/3/14) TaxID=1108050 RepID=A0A0B7FCV0_THACB|nr:hypothetical protein RSOLAG1IB_01888 [Rhizoctonia solani AG-1 IB]
MDSTTQPGGRLDYTEKKINRLTQRLSWLPRGHTKRPLILGSLACAHDDRFNLLGEVEDLDKAIEYMTIGLVFARDPFPGLPGLIGGLAVFHGKRFQNHDDIRDSDQAIEYASLALSLVSEGPFFLAQLSNLAGYHSQRFERVGDLADLQKAMDYGSRALASTPEGSPQLPFHLGNLGMAYYHQFRRIGDPDDLNKAIEYGTSAVDLTPENDPRLAFHLTNIGMFHDTRFERLGEPMDLEKAIEHGLSAVVLTPNGDPYFSNRLSNLGESYRNRFNHLGELEDIEKSIEYQSDAVDLTPKGHPLLASRLSNLGASHFARFERLGELDDIEKAVEFGTRAVDLTQDGNPALPSVLGDLAMSHNIRFNHLGELDDLEKSIKHQSRAVLLIPNGHPSLPSHFSHLGVFHMTRFERLGKSNDLEKAIKYNSRATSSAPGDHPHLPNWIGNLAISYSIRFERSGEPEDLENSIKHQSRALDLTNDGSPELPFRLANIALSYDTRFHQFGEPEDIQKAIDSLSRSLALTPDGHPTLSRRHFSLAGCCLSQYINTGDVSYLQISLSSFRMATGPLSGPPREKFRHALQWAKHSLTHSPLNSTEAYQTTIDLLPQFIWLGATTNQRYEDLLRAEDLAVEAAVVAIRSSNYPLALEWLEHARCVVWNQSLMLRSPLDELYSLDPSLALRLQSIAGLLQNASSDSRGSETYSAGLTTPEKAAQEHRRMAKEYGDLLSRARKFPGFEDFLRPMKSKDLVRAARHGPIVVINCHSDQCDALVITPGQDTVNHVPLPNFTGEKARSARSEIESSLRSKGIRERGFKRLSKPGKKDNFGSVLAALWHDVVKPVLDYLGYTAHPPSYQHSNADETSKDDVTPGFLPHITWCPTGAMTFLPLHAAGDYSQPHSRVFEYVVSSYTPTLTALLSSTPSTPSGTFRLLAVGQETTPGHSELPGVIKELACVEAHMQDKAGYSQLVDHQATKISVLDAMENSDWVHLACHAHQNVVDPTKSGVFLHDGILDLTAIHRRSFKNKGLAFLSACQTATGDEALPDEAIHLASGMLVAGYPSVVATMWSVSDDDAPFVADIVYGELMETGKIGNGEVGKALHCATEKLRNKVGEEQFGRWVPYIHIGS